MKAIDLYCEAMTLEVPRHVIERAVRFLAQINYVEALALVRGSYITEDGWPTVAEAQEILAAIRYEHRTAPYDGLL